ncbi:MAG: hypothetical protein ACKVH2_01530 [Flavobacteriales bacterium]|mgnify:FL=1|jgi:hypothetical protein
MRDFSIIIIMIVFFACKEEINPFDFNGSNINSNNDTLYFLDPTDFSALHNNIFTPTCANSGCHDGTFEPDFRTIESAYNSLVYQPVIKNDINNSFTYRVDPGNSSKSILYHRLIVDIDGISGIMPLSAEYNPEHYWYDNEEEYINNIKDWINNGAKDIFGNSPQLSNDIPLARGMVVFSSGQSNNPINRNSQNGTVLISNNLDSVDLWFSITDDLLASNQLSYNKIKISNSLHNFSNIVESDLVVLNNPISQLGFFSSINLESFYHKFTLDLGLYNVGDIIYVKVYVKDNMNPITEIPNNGSPFSFIQYFSLTII